MFYENYVRLCNAKGKTPSAVALELGIQKSTVTRWGDGSVPRDSTLVKVADYFGVSTQYLLFGDSEEAEEQKKPAADEGSELPKGLREKYSKLSEDHKKLVEQMIDGLLAARE